MKDLVPKARNIRRGNVETAKFAKSEIKSRDQLTIPKKIRVMTRIEGG